MRGDALAGVAHPQDQPRVVGLDLHGDDAARRRVAHAVVQQILHNLLHATGIHQCGRQRAGRVGHDLDPVAAPGQRRRRLHDAPGKSSQVGGLQAQLQAGDLGARQREQIGDQRLQVDRLVLHHLQVLPERRRRCTVPMQPCGFQIAAQRGNRRAQLVRDAGDQLAARLQEFRHRVALGLDLAHGLLELGSHRVEVGLEQRHLVGAFHRDAYLVIASAQLARRVGQRFQPARRAAGEDVGE